MSKKRFEIWLISLFLLFLLAGLIKSLILGFDIVSAFLRVVKFSVFIWLYKQRERERVRTRKD